MKRILLFIWLIFNVLKLSAQLSGIYTIGGASPDYPDFTTAAAALSTQGISGNVTFNVRLGTYEEQFGINQIPGSNVNRTVTFQAENGDSSSVLLLNTTATNTTNYLVRLQNVGQVVLKRLSFQTPETGTYSNAITLYNASNIRLENCSFRGTLNTSTLNENQRVSVLISGICPGFIVRNCLFQNGHHAIGVYGGETLVSPNMVIEDNRFIGTISEAIRAFYANNIRIQRNRVDSCAVAFNLYACSTAVVQQNRIYTTSYGCLYMNDCRGTAANRVVVANNFMANIGNSSQAVGVLLQTCRYLDFFHNSLNIQSGPEQCYGLQLANSNRFLRVQNNSLVVRPGGRPLLMENEPNETEALSHCNLYNGLILNNLPPNSISANPFYVSETDLHVNNAVLNNLGTPLAGVSTDFDGENRNAATPDIGADEYTPVALSAAVAGFVHPSADSVYCAELPLEIVLQNTGFAVLTSAILTVTWNGIPQPAVQWTGNLPSGQSTHVALAALALVPFQANTVQVDISMPNDSEDLFLPDNQLIFANLYAGLSGTFTIGGSSPDFPDFAAAVEALEKGGLCGSTTLLLRDGTYSGQVQIDALKGSSAQNRLTFMGESGDSSQVVLSAPASETSAFTLRLQQCRFMSFKNLTIRQLAHNNNTSPVFVAFGSDILFENCVIQGYFNLFGSAQNSEVAFYAFPDSNLTVRHCVIAGASVGANLVGTGPVKYNLVFENNLVAGGSDDCLNFQYWRNVRVNHNEFIAGSNSSLFGMYGLGLSNYDISNNRVAINGVQATEGIYLINCSKYQPDDATLVSNNAISMNLSESIVAVSRGMWIINCDSIRIIHNTVRHNSTDLDNFAFDMLQSEGAYVVNNVFVNTGLGLAFNSNGNSGSHFDHNVYFTNGALLCYGSAELSGIQAQTGGDLHSVLASPLWTNGMPDSLALKNPALENIGTETDIEVDILGFARQFPNPDPGAFETPTAPVVQLGPDLSVCGATTLHGFAPGASSYLWNTGATTADLQVDTSGTYILTASNEIGTSTDTIDIQVFVLPMVDAGPDFSACYHETYQIIGTSSGTCQWSDPNGFVLSDNCSFGIGLESSVYLILTATSAEQCTASDTVFAEMLPLPVQPVIEWNDGEFSVISTDNLQWYIDGFAIEGATGTHFTSLAQGNYTVVATGQNGCMVSSLPYFHKGVGTNMAFDRELVIFPNPVAGNALFVRVRGNFIPEHFDLFDARGRLVSSGALEMEPAKLFRLPAPPDQGMYFLKISDTAGNLVLKKIERF